MTVDDYSEPHLAMAVECENERVGDLANAWTAGREDADGPTPAPPSIGRASPHAHHSPTSKGFHACAGGSGMQGDARDTDEHDEPSRVNGASRGCGKQEQSGAAEACPRGLYRRREEGCKAAKRQTRRSTKPHDTRPPSPKPSTMQIIAAAIAQCGPPMPAAAAAATPPAASPPLKLSAAFRVTGSVRFESL